MKKLIIIPARSGSKGLPGKNTKLLNGIPLIEYSIEFAKKIAKGEDIICISTNDRNVIDIADKLNIKVPFVRPEELSNDTASTQDVILHAINFYKEINFDFVLLLQPTSPLRKLEDYLELERNFNKNTDLVVTVKESKENPYFSLYEEDDKGNLVKSKASNFTRRQDCPAVYAFNGSMYLFNINSILQKKISDFTKIKKVVVSQDYSIDIDTMEDWVLAEYIIKKNENS